MKYSQYRRSVNRDRKVGTATIHHYQTDRPSVVKVPSKICSACTLLLYVNNY